ncbi:DUF1801 domain-containing protein [Rathayibacter sp. VKM Ac-2754]|uniref:DUF1801 domain-containing protein n=1 Tax=Rathayibacter sp. VKM Ac-2754 TaxID=2609251 RepID=UPI0013579F14|nr:DUF1801 domain-containing protein [Rathayibacter sp. VKM Ac-2754]MWV59246.1 DUF1801 domain-containing protein [Rathayibacter sp. VKM Ac-2754]
MTRLDASATAHVDAMAHPRREQIEAVREAVLAADDRLVESVKWNAPSYAIGAHLVTLRLRPGDRVELILHRGVAPRADAVAPVLDDPRLDWRAPDRAVRALAPEEDPRLLTPLVHQWLAAVAPRAEGTPDRRDGQE